MLVIITGPSRKPDSLSHVVPVISPLPFKVNQPPKLWVFIESRPRGNTAVTPVLTALPSGRSSTRVTWPTVTPETSVIALYDPGVPSNGIPRSRARGSSAEAAIDTNTNARIHRHDFKAVPQVLAAKMRPARSAARKAHNFAADPLCDLVSFLFVSDQHRDHQSQ